MSAGLLRVPVQPVRLLRGGGLHQRDGADQERADAYVLKNKEYKDIQSLFPLISTIPFNIHNPDSLLFQILAVTVQSGGVTPQLDPVHRLPAATAVPLHHDLRTFGHAG